MTRQLCPNCRAELKSNKVSEGVVWTCDECGGLATNVALLRRHSAKGVAGQLWRSMWSSRMPSHQKCPSCDNFMTEFNVENVAAVGTAVCLSGCVNCQSLWFDRGNLEQLRVSFSGAPRESTAIPIPSNTESVRAEATLASYEIVHEIGWLLDQIDFDFGD